MLREGEAEEKGGKTSIKGSYTKTTRLYNKRSKSGTSTYIPLDKRFMKENGIEAFAEYEVMGSVLYGEHIQINLLRKR